MVPALSVSRQAEGTMVTLRPAGDLTTRMLAQLLARLVQEVTAGDAVEVVVDLDAVTRLAAKAVAVLLGGYQFAVDHGVRLRVVNTGDAVRQQLEHCGLFDVLADSDDLGALIAAVIIAPTASGQQS
jgi:anti-anti-sigma factor